MNLFDQMFGDHPLTDDEVNQMEEIKHKYMAQMPNELRPLWDRMNEKEQALTILTELLPQELQDLIKLGATKAQELRNEQAEAQKNTGQYL